MGWIAARNLPISRARIARPSWKSSWRPNQTCQTTGDKTALRSLVNSAVVLQRAGSVIESRDRDAALLGTGNGLGIACIDMTDDPCGRVTGQDALQAHRRLVGAVGDHDHAGMQA